MNNTNIPTEQRFRLMSDVFLNTVKRSPVCCSLTVTSFDESATGYDAIVGNSARTTVTKSFPCLYTRAFDNHIRTKYGLTDLTSCIIHLPPKFLVDAFGTYKLDARRVRFEIINQFYVCERVVFNGEMPHYNSCVSVEFRLMDDVKA